MSHFRTIETSNPALALDGLRFVTVKSPALGQRADLCLWTAPGVTINAPLVVLLHGVYGSHWAWALKGAAHLTAARLISEGALPPLVLAMPSDGLWGDGSGYVPHASQDFERWIMEDVPHAAAETISAVDPDAPFCIAGLSMGGFAALRLAGKYPARILAAAGHSSATSAAALDPLMAEDRGNWSAAAEDQTIMAAFARTRSTLPALYFDCGLDDPYLADNRALAAAFTAQGIVHTYREGAGGHDWDYWTAQLEQSLRFFGQALRGVRKG